MMLLETLKSKAIERQLLKPEEEIDLEKAFLLVRDMPYTRASSRDPEIIIQEWRGTCSGKHYLLKGLFAELGYTSRLIACTTVTHIDPQKATGKLRRLLEQSEGRFVDVHNYLVLELPEIDIGVLAIFGSRVGVRVRVAVGVSLAGCVPVAVALRVGVAVGVIVAFGFGVAE